MFLFLKILVRCKNVETHKELKETIANLHKIVLVLVDIFIGKANKQGKNSLNVKPIPGVIYVINERIS